MQLKNGARHAHLNLEVLMAPIWSILELMTSPFGSETMKYCSFKVLLEAKLADQKFFGNLLQPDFDSAAPASFWSNFCKKILSLKWPLQNPWHGPLDGRGGGIFGNVHKGCQIFG